MPFASSHNRHPKEALVRSCVREIKQSVNIATSWSGGPGRETIIGAMALNLIMSAVDPYDYEISVGPSWLNVERFDINAKAEGNPTAEQMRLMMRSLLEERFALTYRREAKERPVYRLTRARKDGTLGAQLVKSDVVDCDELRRRGEKIAAGACSFTRLVTFLESAARRRIIDETGLTR